MTDSQQQQTLELNAQYYRNLQSPSADIWEQVDGFFSALTYTSFMNRATSNTEVAGPFNDEAKIIENIWNNLAQGQLPPDDLMSSWTDKDLMQLQRALGKPSALWESLPDNIAQKKGQSEFYQKGNVVAVWGMVLKKGFAIRDKRIAAAANVNVKNVDTAKKEQKKQRENDTEMKQEEKGDDVPQKMPGQNKSKAEDIGLMVAHLRNCLSEIKSQPIELTVEDVRTGFKVAYGMDGKDIEQIGPYFTTYNELRENHLIMVNGAVTTTPNNFIKYIESLTIPGEEGSQDYQGFFTILRNKLNKAVEVRRRYNKIIKVAINRILNENPEEASELIKEYSQQLSRICETELDDYSGHILNIEILKDVVDKFFASDSIRQFFGQSTVQDESQLLLTYNTQICAVTSLINHFSPLITFQKTKLIPGNFIMSNLIKKHCDIAKEEKVIANQKARYKDNPDKLKKLDEQLLLVKRKQAHQETLEKDNIALTKLRQSIRQSKNSNSVQDRFKNIQNKYTIISNNFGDHFVSDMVPEKP